MKIENNSYDLRPDGKRLAAGVVLDQAVYVFTFAGYAMVHRPKADAAR